MVAGVMEAAAWEEAGLSRFLIDSDINYTVNFFADPGFW